MADFRFKCPSCGQSLEAPEEMTGELIDCPTCNTEIEIPQNEPAEAAPRKQEILISSVPSPAGGMTKCPGCGSSMAAESVLCVKCGFHRKLGKKISTQLG